MTTQIERQMLGCGYEAPLSPHRVRDLMPWDADGREPANDETDDDGTLRTPVCIGYLLALPEVRETSRARLHWSKGQLATWTTSEPATEQLITAIEVLEVSTQALERWAMTPKDKGGGAGA